MPLPTRARIRAIMAPSKRCGISSTLPPGVVRLTGTNSWNTTAAMAERHYNRKPSLDVRCAGLNRPSVVLMVCCLKPFPYPIVEE